MTTQTAIRTGSFINTLGVNTHIDFAAYGYQNLTVVANSVKYLGLTNLRDSAQTASDATTWQQVAQATGARFDDYIAEASPAGMTTDLGFVTQLAHLGLLSYLEGGNEEDDAYPASLGNTLPITAQFQQQVYATGHALGLPVINMSFGAGWTAANNWQGDYGAVGDLSAVADYANAHTYPNVGQGTDWSVQRLNGLAHLAAASRPVITTEIGWDENQGFAQADVAKFALDATMDGMKNGDVRTYFYGLFDDGAGKFGLMNSDGTAKPAGVAIHNLTTLLADTGATAASFTPGSLSYTLSGTTAADNTLVMQKSDGSYWLSLWNESDAAHNVTLSLGGASEIKVFDPLTGTAVLQDVRNTASASFAVADHPVIVQVIGASGAPPASGAVLTVGPGQQYASIAAAVAAARAGDTVNVQAGTYTNDFVNVYKNITLQAVGGVVKMLATVNPPNGKAIIDEGGSGVNITINGFDISGAVVADGNGAAIRYEGGTLTLNNDYIHNNQDGLLSAADPAGRISINASEFAYNGKGDGYTHNLYVGDVASLSITNSYFHDASEGHEIKSRAESTTITGSRIYDNNSTASYSVDLPNGGNATIQNDVIQQGPNSDNPAIISYGEEGSLHAGTTVVIANNTIVNARTGSAVGVVNQALYAVTLQGNSVYGLTSSNLTSGTATVSGTSYLLSSPTLDTSSSWMPAAPPPGPTPTDLVVATPASESLVAGTSLVVSGVSISDPWAAATPGTMTLNVWDAGGGTIAMAGQTATSSGRISVSGTLAQLNTWLAGLSYTAGASQGGDTITVDVWNQAGIEVQKAIGVTVAAPPPPPPPPPAASITTGSGSDTLVLSMSEDAYQGDAKFTVTVDGRQLGGTYTATAPHAAGGSQNFTFMGDWASGTHTVAVNFLNDAWGGTAATDRNLYVNGISYDGAATGQSAALMGAGPKSFALTDGTAVPAAVTGSGSDSLVLGISEDAYLGNAQFTVAVDGRQLGGTFTATALHGSGASQAFVFKGDFGPGAHAVAVKFLNDAWAGTPATDRNLYVDSVTYRGANTTQSAALLSAGARIFAVSGGTTPSVSETSDHGSLQKNLAQTGSYSVGGDTFVLSSGNAASVTLGTGASRISFLGASSVTLTGGSGQDVVSCDAGDNRFVAGTGSLEVTGGGGRDAYVFHAGGGLLTIDDFSLAKGDTLTVDRALQGSLYQASDGQGGTLLTFGAGNGHGVDIHGMAAMPSGNFLWG